MGAEDPARAQRVCLCVHAVECTAPGREGRVAITDCVTDVAQALKQIQLSFHTLDGATGGGRPEV
jgi:hypothetical protein